MRNPERLLNFVRVLPWLLCCAALAVSTLAWAGPVEDAQRLLGAERAAEAERVLSRYLVTNPDDRAARYLLAAAMAAQGRLDAAYAEYTALVAQDATDGVGRAVTGLLEERGRTVEDARKIEALFADTTDAVGRGDLAVAVQLLEQVVRLAPRNLAARGNLAALLGKLGRHEDAVEHLSAVAQANPQDIQAWQRLGEGQERARRPEQAKQTYLEIVRKRPRDGAALFALGRLALFNDRDFAAAEAWLQKVVEVAPNHADGAYLLGMALVQLDRKEDALAAFQRAVTANPKHFQAHFQLGVLHEAARRDQQSLDEFKLVVRWGGDSNEASQARRRLQLYGGDAEGAVEVRRLSAEAVLATESGDLKTSKRLLLEILSRVPDNALARYNLATVYSREGNNSGAEEQLKRVLTLDPENYLAHYGLGLIYAGGGRFELAYEAFRNAERWTSDKDPRKVVARTMLQTLGKTIEGMKGQEESRGFFLKGVELANAKDFDGAQDAFLQALKLDPSNPYYRYNLALVYSERGRPDWAYRELREVVRYKPDYVQAHFRIGLFFMAAGVYQDAMDAFAKVVEYGTDEPEVAEARRQLSEVGKDADRKEKSLAYLVIGKALMLTNDREKALQAYRWAHELDPDNPRPLDQYVELLMILGRDQEAEDLLDKAVLWFPTYFPFHFNLGQIEKGKKDYEQAEIHLKKALELQPGQSAALDVLGGLYRETGRAEDALDLMDKLVQANPDSEKAVLAKGRLLVQLERYADAAVLYDWYLVNHDETATLLLERGKVAQKLGVAGGAGPTPLTGGAAGTLSSASNSAVVPKYGEASEWFQRAIVVSGPQDSAVAASARALLEAERPWALSIQQTLLNFNTNANNSAVRPRPAVSSSTTFTATYTPLRRPNLSLPLTYTTAHSLHYTFQTYVNTDTLQARLPVSYKKLRVTPLTSISRTRNQSGRTSITYVGEANFNARLRFPAVLDGNYSRTEFVSYLNPGNNYLQVRSDVTAMHQLKLGRNSQITLALNRVHDHRTAVVPLLDVDRIDLTRSLNWAASMSHNRVVTLGLSHSGSHELRRGNLNPITQSDVPVPILSSSNQVSCSYSFKPYSKVTAAFNGSLGSVGFRSGLFTQATDKDGKTVWVETTSTSATQSLRVSFTYDPTPKVQWSFAFSHVKSRASTDVPVDLDALLANQIIQDNINRQKSAIVSMRYTF